MLIQIEKKTGPLHKYFSVLCVKGLQEHWSYRLVFAVM